MKMLDSFMLYVTIPGVCPHRLVWSRTQAFQAWYMGSNPVGGTNNENPPFFRGGFLCVDKVSELLMHEHTPNPRQ
jgi:hypothetical protein